MIGRISPSLTLEELSYNMQNANDLFPARIVLDTALARPYYAARKF